ncbi:MAG: ADP-ribosylglycohydrolase family protein [Tissierellia bacterium]|nr:ADP-ribosylglycohydrolase family protein [Tissierellia bacterium]
MKERIRGSLLGAAIGDAMGSATETMSEKRILQVHGESVMSFLTPSEGNIAYGREAGQITESFGIAQALLTTIAEKDGECSTQVGKEALLKWAEDEAVFEQFAGMTTKKVINTLRDQGSKMNYWEYSGRLGTKLFKSHFYALSSNGAATKAFIPGLINVDNIDRGIQDTIDITMSSHDDVHSISGACAVAAATCQALREGATVESIVDAAFYGAEEGIARSRVHALHYPGPSVIKRIEMAVKLALRGASPEERIQSLVDYIGTGPAIAETVPVALGILIIRNGALMPAIYDAVNIGDETSAIATIVGAIGGAYQGDSTIPFELEESIQKQNHLQIDELVKIVEQLQRKWTEA